MTEANESHQEKIILAEIDSSLVFKALQKQGLLQPGTPVTITDDTVRIGTFAFKSQAAKCIGTNLIYDVEALENIGNGKEFPSEAIIATVNEIHQLQPIFK